MDERVRSRIIEGVAGLDMHVLEAGFESGDSTGAGRPVVILLHGFPEIAFSWRHQLIALAEAGYHAVAPDQRGYGKTTGWEAGYETDLAPWRMGNLVADIVALVGALGHRRVHGLVGHDFGSPVAAWAAVIRPDVFQRVVLMSAPFAGTPPMDRKAGPTGRSEALMASLGNLDPPRKHYQWYFSSRQAAKDLAAPPQGLERFLREYYHVKSGDDDANRPEPLAGWQASELARLPRYYVMDRDSTMPETTAAMVGDASIAEPSWLPDADLATYVDAYRRAGFQGGLNWYRASIDPRSSQDLRLFAGRAIDVPSLFIAGARDWGIHQSPGALQRMQDSACTDLRGVELLEGAGHWVQQERAAAVNELLVSFFADT